MFLDLGRVAARFPAERRRLHFLIILTRPAFALADLVVQAGRFLLDLVLLLDDLVVLGDQFAVLAGLPQIDAGLVRSHADLARSSASWCSSSSVRSLSDRTMAILSAPGSLLSKTLATNRR